MRDAVHAAVAELVAENGPERLTIPAVAALAGVNPTTVYRRWGDVDALIRDVAAARLRPDDPAPDTGSLRRDLLAWGERTLGMITAPDGLALLRGSVSRVAADPTLSGPSPRMAARERQIAAILAAAEQRGESAPSLRHAMDYLLAPLYFRVMLGIGPTDIGYVRVLVDDLLEHYA